MLKKETSFIIKYHKPLCGVLRKSDRQKRQLAIIAEYISYIGHMNRDQKVMSDCLARHTLAVDLYDLPDIASAQLKEFEFKKKQTSRLKINSFLADNNNCIYCIYKSTGVH